MTLNYEWYRTFYTVVKEGGFSKAADKLCVTQPAVSQAIRRLEECAGVKLFIRRSGNPVPTEAGRRLFSFIERGVEWFASGENFLGRLSNPNAGEVTVGVSESACRFFILPHIKEMRQRFPDLKLKIKEGNTAQSLEALIRGEIDCALIMAPLNRLNASIRLTTLKSCRFGLYSSEIFTDIPEQPRPLKDYAACPFLMLDKRTETRKAADKFFTAHNIAVNVRIELSSVGLVKDFLKSGFYQAKSSISINIAVYFCRQSFFVLGSVIWPKRSFVNTCVALVCISIAYITVGVIVAKVFAEQFKVHVINGIYSSEDSFSFVVISLCSFIALFNWTLAYFRFKESEIINRW